MASTKQIVSHDFSGGVNYGAVPHKVADGRFIDMRNYRPFRGELVQTDLMRSQTLTVPDGKPAEDIWLLRRFWNNAPLFFAVRNSSVMTFAETGFAHVKYVDTIVTPTAFPEQRVASDVVVLQATSTSWTKLDVEILSGTTFRWRLNDGTWSSAITITFAHTLAAGITIFFLVRRGFVPDDLFTWTRGTMTLVNAQYLTHCAFEKDVFWAGHKGRVLAYQLPAGDHVRQLPFLGQYVDNFFNHLVVGRFSPAQAGSDEPLWGEQAKYTIGWSDLERPDVLTPVDFPINEAGFYAIPNEFNNAFSEGITGLKVFGQFCYVFTPTTIWRMNYVGLPTVMFIEQMTSGVGNALHYCLVRGTQALYFIGEDDFYAFNGEESPAPIGGAVRDMFQREYLFRTGTKRIFGEFDTFRREVVWTMFVNATQTCFQLVFQEGTSEWFVRNLPSAYVESGDIHCFAQSAQRANKLVYAGAGVKRDFIPTDPTIAALPDTKTGSISDSLIVDEGVVIIVGPFYVLQDGVILSIGSTLSVPGENNFVTPFVETPDFTHGSLPDVKEVDSLYFDGSSPLGTGFDIYVHVRDFYSSAVQESDWIFCGTWLPKTQLTPGLPEIRLSEPRLSGRVFRYRFVAHGLPRECKMRSWHEFVYAARAEK